MSLRVAVDFGTSSTCVVASVDGREPQVVVVDGQPLMPSAVFAAEDGTLFVGAEAERQAAIDPARYEPYPKRRVDEGELLLGTTVLPVSNVVHAVLRRAVDEARHLADRAVVDLLVLTHPAEWGATRTRLLRQAAHGLAREFVLVPEPVAAAVFHSTLQAEQAAADGPAEPVAVLDLGGGTVDVSVVRRAGTGFEVLATRGNPGFGGADIDQALLDHVGGTASAVDPAGWQELTGGRDLPDRRRRRVLFQDVRGAKETLSRHSYTDIPLPPPFADALVTRSDLEALIHDRIAEAADLVGRAARDAGVEPGRLGAVFLVGGSSRIPLVARLVHERVGVVPTTLDQPETVVARGALRAVALDPERTSGVAAVRAPSGTPARGLRGPVAAPVPPAVRSGSGTPPPGFPPAGPPVAAPPGHYGPPGPAPLAGGPFPPRGGGPVVGPPPRPAHGPPPLGKGRGRRDQRRWWLLGGALVAALAVAAALVVFVLPRSDREIALYDYRFAYPADWEQSGGDAAQRKVQIRPEGAAEDTDLVVVQEWRLDYDSDADRERAASELRQSYEERNGSVGGSTFAGFDVGAEYAGRDVVYYRQDRADGRTVDWYHLFDGRLQVAVGCQYTPQGAERVAQACERVVDSLRIG
ncbi:type VII secretion-associated protein [Actinoalloteichus sp. AHMU CJ021]|uniref:type VII secretion-associated protein n=1 Tax=Actinoalloteichus sp. AHMU CJ021 TaxID=2072503 RepID=UPI000CA07343|nr:type VII secretion-associated protein [Actinoalloteichus sp. AHMU CJ021]